MARAGETIENPATGERFVFLKTAGDTGGELLQVELFMRPGGGVPGYHVHRRQEERFQVLSGAPRFRVRGKVFTLGKGESLPVPARTPHVFSNPGDDELHLIIEFRPALNVDRIFEESCRLAREGLFTKRGRPKVLPAALAFGPYLDESAWAGAPIWLQKAGLRLLTPFAQAAGYRAI